jgi:AraC family cel operon transcriptional repressor
LERLLYAAKSLAGQERSLFVCERFLMNAVYELSQGLGFSGSAKVSASVPDWLSGAHDAMLSEANLRAGVKRLFKLAGRCREHVARSFKDCYGVTPVEFVNQRRMLLAESLLLTGDAKIPDVARACGIRNLSHFHKLFLERYGLSPRRFRVERRSVVI